MLKYFFIIGQYVLFGLAVTMFASGKYPVYIPAIVMLVSDIWSTKVSVIELKEELANIKNKVN